MPLTLRIVQRFFFRRDQSVHASVKSCPAPVDSKYARIEYSAIAEVLEVIKRAGQAHGRACS